MCRTPEEPSPAFGLAAPVLSPFSEENSQIMPRTPGRIRKDGTFEGEPARLVTSMEDPQRTSRPAVGSCWIGDTPRAGECDRPRCHPSGMTSRMWLSPMVEVNLQISKVTHLSWYFSFTNWVRPLDREQVWLPSAPQFIFKPRSVQS